MHLSPAPCPAGDDLYSGLLISKECKLSNTSLSPQAEKKRVQHPQWVDAPTNYEEMRLLGSLVTSQRKTNKSGQCTLALLLPSPSSPTANCETGLKPYLILHNAHLNHLSRKREKPRDNFVRARKLGFQIIRNLILTLCNNK